MSVLNDYECAMHGVFEAFERKCPYGCSRAFVKQVFLKAPATKSKRTRGIDRELRNLADDYNLPDIRAKKDSGTSTMQELGRDGKASKWLEVPPVKPGWSQRGEQAPTFSISALTKDPSAGPGWKPGTLPMPAAKIVGGRYQE